MAIAGGGGDGEVLLEAGGPPLTPEEEREAVGKLKREAEANTRDGDLQFLVSQWWWTMWQEYVGLIKSDGDGNDGVLSIAGRPGEIDNSKLVIEGQSDVNGNPILRRDLREGEDYALISQEVWKKLHEWYKGGPEISRRVIFVGPSSRDYIVDVYPLCLNVEDSRDNTMRPITISRKAKVRELRDMICSLLGVEQSKVDLWDCFETSKVKLRNPDVSLEDAQILMDQKILAEVKADSYSNAVTDSAGNGLASVALELPKSLNSTAGGPALSNGHPAENKASAHSTEFGSNSYSSQGSSNGISGPSVTRSSSAGFGLNFLQGKLFGSMPRDSDDVYGASSSKEAKSEDQGLTGLTNLGNTCFMNSALQCLVHTPPLVSFFLGDYTEQINRVNPLGMQGELAIAFGDLLRKLWSTGSGTVGPRAFKAKLSKFAPQFSGYNQHDSQELLAFLLDGLHEDLNRVVKKPYIEFKDSDGTADAEFAEKCWRNHKARNDSVIVDLFQGQYKSTLVCPVCNKVSVTFDPFMYLSLPLPSTITRMMTVTVINGKGAALPMPYTVTVPKNGSCKDLIKALGVACCLTELESLLLAEVYDRRIYRYVQNLAEPLFGIKDSDQLVAYRLPAGHERLLKIEIFHRKTDRIPDAQFNMQRKLIGIPLVTCISNISPSKADIYSAVSLMLAPLLRVTALTHPSKPNGSSPSLDSIALTDNDPSSSSDMDPSSSPDEAVAPDAFPTFQLWLTDDRGFSKMPIQQDSNRVLGLAMKLLLEWSDKEFERYDVSYIEEIPDVFKPGFLSKKTKQDAITLFSCLEAFLKEEPLGPDDMWYCPSCKEHRQATKKLDLWRLPEILVFHLKRFSFSRYFKNKLDSFVSFPIRNLDLSSYVNNPTSQSPVYELFAVSNHYGNLGGGHYTAYAKLVQEDRWYHFDDSHVSPVSEEAIKTSAAYVLFYKRVDLDTMAAKGKTSPDAADNDDIDDDMD